jgi:hypothetical protein
MNVVIEVPLPAGSMLRSEDLESIAGRTVRIVLDGEDIFGIARTGTVIGAVVSPRDKYLRVVVDCES